MSVLSVGYSSTTVRCTLKLTRRRCSSTSSKARCSTYARTSRTISTS